MFYCLYYQSVHFCKIILAYLLDLFEHIYKFTLKILWALWNIFIDFRIPIYVKTVNASNVCWTLFLACMLLRGVGIGVGRKSANSHLFHWLRRPNCLHLVFAVGSVPLPECLAVWVLTWWRGHELLGDWSSYFCYAIFLDL